MFDNAFEEVLSRKYFSQTRKGNGWVVFAWTFEIFKEGL